MYFEGREEEAEDKIYRIPPPGNVMQTQTRITDYFSRPHNNELRVYNEIPENIDHRTRNSEVPIPDQNYNLKILQWNARSLNFEKRMQLEILIQRRMQT